VVSPSLPGLPRGGSFSAVGNTVLFPVVEAAGAASGELWRSDGTPAGTSLLTNIYRVTGSSNPNHLTAVGGNLFFTTVAAPGIAAGLWRSDGTDAGTVLVRPGPASLLTRVGDMLYFTAPGAANGIALWRTDGTAAGTVPVKELPTGAAGVPSVSLIAGQTRLYFAVRTSNSAYELWTSDGTTVGTVPATPRTFGLVGWPTTVGDTLYFNGFVPGGPEGAELWKSDGTPAGTAVVKDLDPGSGGANPSGLTPVNESLYFTAWAPGVGYGVWKTDGTAEGTVLVHDTYEGVHNPPIQNLTAVGDSLYFAADHPTYGYELWKSDGATGVTAPVLDLWPGLLASMPSQLTAAGDTLYFLAADPVNGRGLWRTDGTTAGTTRIRTVQDRGGLGAFMVSVNGTLFYSDAGFLWRSDGTREGTVQVLKITDSATDMEAVGERLFVRGNDPAIGVELFAVPTGAPVSVVKGRQVFYNNSALDGHTTGAGDDAAIAAGTVPLLPGVAASRANITNYARGINGVLIDIAGLPKSVTLTAADFDLWVGNGSTWSDAPAPMSVTTRRAAGAGGSDRVTLTFADNAIRNTWLRVTIKPGARTGLAAADTFDFGNLAGDTGGTGSPVVNSLDLARVRANVGNAAPAAVASYDFNRDRRVNAADVLITRANLGRSLPLFTAPTAAARGAGLAGARTAGATPAARAPFGPTRRGVWDALQADATSITPAAL
jgi:ELWxxDGT repeat protein